MSKLSYDDFRSWGVDEVSSWLGEIHLSNHIPSFERNGITGARLAEITDKEIKDTLRVVKPSELMALKGALSSLMRAPPRKLSGQRKTMTSLPRELERCNSTEKRVLSPMEHRTHTLPQMSALSTGMPKGVVTRATVRTPELKAWSAPELLDDQCRYSGWIRKQGGGHKNWKRRYLILRTGCLYYFSNETASSPKGKFVLSGYEVSICREPDILKKYPFVLKLAPMNPQVRTYYVAFSSKGELERWKHELDEEIEQYNQSISQRVVMPLGSSSLQPPMGEEDDEFEFEEETIGNIYDKVDGDEPEYEKADGNIYDDPADIDGTDDEGHYDRVEQLSPPPSLTSADGKPVVPDRSQVSLQQPIMSQQPPISNPGEDDIYLPIIGENSVQGAVQPPVVADRPNSTPVHTTREKSPEEDFIDPSDDEMDGSGPDSDDDGGYYIMFRKPDELMPQSCLFDRLDRADADKLLRTLNMDGTYLIREGTHAGAEKVLSVWHIDRCRHYKLFKDDDNCFSLTQGQRFRNMPELLQYYSLQSHLPRSDFYLGNPYSPLDR